MTETQAHDRAALIERLEEMLVMIEQIYEKTGAIGHSYPDIIRGMIEDLRKGEHMLTTEDAV